MADRKAELERKKLKLEQMREERRRAEEAKKKSGTPTVAAPDTRSDTDRIRSETDTLLNDLGIPAPDPTERQSIGKSDSVAESLASSEPVLITRKQTCLSVSKVTQTTIPPKEMVLYNKETQTPVEVIEKEARPLDYYGNGAKRRPHGSPKFLYPNLEWDDDFSLPADEDGDSLDVAIDTPPASIGSHHHVAAAHGGAITKRTESIDETGAHPPVIETLRELSDEERRKIETSEEFQHFFDRAVRVVERAIYEEVDIFTDYSGINADDRSGGITEGDQLKANRQFFDERWAKHRTVTSLDWSMQFPELLLASYNNNEDSPHEPDGVCLVWNLKYKKSTPEYIFHCQSPVMSACFAKFHPNLIIGGTYSGQIVLWDNRSNKRTPIQRTPLSTAVHTHPVYCVNVVGTQNAHNLISVSTDGKMCFWSLDMLSQPQDSMELQHKQSKAVAATCFSFPYGDFNNFVVGSEEGAVYTACRHGSKAGINEMFEGHQGPVTGIDCHQAPGQIDFSPYFISSSFDWTVKLWNIKESRPLLSFEDNSEYVYDAKWSPLHPALFAAVDGTGRLDLWNLNNDTEVPTASTVVEGGVALNKCHWHHAGHCIAAGDDIGRLHIYDVGESLAVPRSDDWSKLVHTLQDVKLEQTEQDEEQSSILSQSPMR